MSEQDPPVTDVTLRRRLLRFHGRDPFLREMREYVRFGGELTARQARKAEHHLTTASLGPHAAGPAASRNGEQPA